MISRKWTAAGIILTLLLLLPGAGAALTAPEVISQVIQAYGGREVVAKIDSVCASGEIVAFAFNNAQGKYSYCVAKDRKLRVDIDYAEFAEHRVLNGATAYVQTGGSPTRQLTSGANYLSIVYQYEQLNLPRTLLERPERIRYAGREPRDAGPVDVLALDAAAGLTMKIYVDAATGHIVKTSGIFQLGTTQMVLSADFSDFRMVKGTIFPFNFINFAGDDKIAVTTIEGYELNSSLTGNTFQSP